jgi:4'-phosphopantetheinyl transferase
MNLAPDTAHVWWLAVDDVPERAWSAWPSVLDDEERARAARFIRDADRRQFIAAHVLLRAMLQHFVGGPASAWRFVADRHGKPSLAPDFGLSRLEFNISHTRGAVACGMVLDRQIGVDIEDRQRTLCHLQIADGHFAPAEIAHLRSVPSEQQQALFYRLWTLKEAYIKAIGSGLSAPLDRFAFALAPIRIGFESGFDDDAACWQFESCDPTEHHTLSIAIRRSAGNPVTVLTDQVTASDIDPVAADTFRHGRT